MGEGIFRCADHPNLSYPRPLAGVGSVEGKSVRSKPIFTGMRLDDTKSLRRSRRNASAVGSHGFFPGWFFFPAPAARRRLTTRGKPLPSSKETVREVSQT